MPKNLKSSFLPALRRSTFRAPDPEAARAFDAAKPDASAAPDADAVEQRAAAVAAVLADLDLPDAAPEAPVRRRSSALPVPERTEAAAVDVVPEPPGSSTRLPHPRHRVDRKGNRRPSGGLRRTVLVGCASAMLGGVLIASVAVTDADRDAAVAAGDTRESAIEAAASGDAADDSVTSEIDETRPIVTGGLSAEEAPFTGGTQVTVEGRNLDEVAQVTVAGAPAQIVAATPVAITFAVPAVDGTVRGEADVQLTDAAGSPVVVETPAAPSAPAVADWAATATDPLAITYTSDPGIDAQMSPAWSSSTALRDDLLTQPGLATALTDAQRAQVEVGDIAQFDWDGSGDRDHIAVVTRVGHTDQGTKVWVGGHTKDADYWDVDQALASGGGAVSYFSLS